MTARPFRRLVRRASWRRFLGAAALLAFYAGWFAAGDSPLTRARRTAGRLPELTPGFHPGEPAATLSRLGAARGDYLWAQAFDAVFVALAAMTALFALALAARTSAALTALHALMLVPVAYAGAELFENLLLASFAAGALAPAPTLASLQQAATTAKLAGGFGSMALAIFAVSAATIAAMSRKRA